MNKLKKCRKCNNTLVYIHYTRGFFDRGGDIWEVSCWWCGYILEDITHGYMDEEIIPFEKKVRINKLMDSVPSYKKIFGTKYHEKYMNPLYNLMMK